MVATLFSSLNTYLDDDDTIDDLENVQPVLIVMQKTMPIFRQIAELWVEELDVLEVWKNLHKKSLLYENIYKYDSFRLRVRH